MAYHTDLARNVATCRDAKLIKCAVNVDLAGPLDSTSRQNVIIKLKEGLAGQANVDLGC